MFDNNSETVPLDDLKQSIQVNLSRKDNNGNISVIEAIRNDDVETIKCLLSNGSPGEALRVCGSGNALIEACLRENVDVVSLLLNDVVVVDFQTNDGLTALMIASASGNKQIVQLLLEKGADITVQNEDGMTAIDYANDELKSDIIQSGVAALRLHSFPQVAESSKEIGLH